MITMARFLDPFIGYHDGQCRPRPGLAREPRAGLMKQMDPQYNATTLKLLESAAYLTMCETRLWKNVETLLYVMWICTMTEKLGKVL